VCANQLAVLRMLPFARTLRAAGNVRGLAVARLRYAVRGWNGLARSPVRDAHAALDDLAARYPDAPVALVGHSMGGRAAIYVAGHPAVRAVVALAPWIERGDPVDPVRGRRVLVAHGDADRVTSPAAAAAYARSAALVAESVSFVRVHGDGHAMLRRSALWHQLASEFVLGACYGPAAASTAIAALVAEALGGEPALSV
jgi:pimeloyl-ACP methyl ester carboxylesterase